MHKRSARNDDTPQHMQALQRANQVRLARAELKRHVGAGKVSVRDVILQRRWEAESMTVAELLQSQQRWGDTRAGKVLTRIGVPEAKTVGAMTDRQRRALAEAIH